MMQKKLNKRGTTTLLASTKDKKDCYRLLLLRKDKDRRFYDTGCHIPSNKTTFTHPWTYQGDVKKTMVCSRKILVFRIEFFRPCPITDNFPRKFELPGPERGSYVCRKKDYDNVSSKRQTDHFNKQAEVK
ncbi:hypothetical protein CEXT_388371 [Caerostris extrusa]|uniref:Uncharacterized protein n=1 Tax=Caerostris extrusa TaxID=172846 RepID=A0AAV4URV8_CAEEX|nr:hypothetical protein CEXT_388371 [Caerostris extrusa]